MSRRVVLGEFGPSVNDYGLRISRPGFDAANATNSSLVDINNLLFDSNNSGGTVKLVASNSSISVAGDSSTTWSYGVTLADFPIILYRYYYASGNNGSSSSTQLFGAEGPFSYQGFARPTYGVDGVFFSANKSSITFYNSNASTATVAVCIVQHDG